MITHILLVCFGWFAISVYTTLICNTIRIPNFEVLFGATHPVTHNARVHTENNYILCLERVLWGQNNNKWTVGSPFTDPRSSEFYCQGILI